MWHRRDKACRRGSGIGRAFYWFERGVFVIAVTLFGARGALDLDSLDRVTDFYLAAGADGLTILGMMGEAPQLTQAESREVIARVITRAGAAPVVVGVSAPVSSVPRNTHPLQS